MPRRRRGLALAAPIAALAAVRVVAQERPNLVFILADDARYEDLMAQEAISETAGWRVRACLLRCGWWSAPCARRSNPRTIGT